MPPYLHAPDDATAHRHRHRAGDATSSTTPTPKRSQSFLSLLLKPLIMILITTIFFIFLGFAALFLFNLCLVGGFLHRRRIHQTNQLAPPPPLSIHGDALSPRDLRRLPKFKHCAASRDLCAVCLDGFRQDQWCRKLSGCGHVFHRSCVDTWLVKVASCPICRTQVRAEPESTGWRLGCDRRGFKQFPTFSIRTY